MLKAAELWAQARIEGYPTAHSEAIDGDVILAAQAILIQLQGHSVTIDRVPRRCVIRLQYSRRSDSLVD